MESDLNQKKLKSQEENNTNPNDSKNGQETEFPPITGIPDDYQPNLEEAVTAGNLRSIQYLTEVEDVSCDVKFKNESTPLHIACWKGYFLMVKYLCEKWNANPNAKNDLGWTPLCLACN